MIRKFINDEKEYADYTYKHSYLVQNGLDEVQIILDVHSYDDGSGKFYKLDLTFPVGNKFIEFILKILSEENK